MRDGWERAGRPPAGWMGPSFFAVALVHGLRGDQDAYNEWWQLATTICQQGNGNTFSLYVAHEWRCTAGRLTAPAPLR